MFPPMVSERTYGSVRLYKKGYQHSVQVINQTRQPSAGSKLPKRLLLHHLQCQHHEYYPSGIRIGSDSSRWHYRRFLSEKNTNQFV